MFAGLVGLSSDGWDWVATSIADQPRAGALALDRPSAGYIGGNLAGNSRAAQVAASVTLVLAYGRVSVTFLERQKKSDRGRCRTSTGR
jgi:hypothetical protein